MRSNSAKGRQTKTYRQSLRQDIPSRSERGDVHLTKTDVGGAVCGLVREPGLSSLLSVQSA